MLNLPEHPAQEQAGQGRADELGDDVARTRLHGKSPRSADASDTPGFRCAPETAPMNKMIAITIRPGATTAAARLICPFACKSPPPPAAARTSAKVPSNSENSRRHSLRGSSKSLRSPNSSRSMQKYVVRARERRPQRRPVDLLGRCPTHSIRPCAVPRVPGPSSRLTGTSSAMSQSLHQQHRRSFTMRIASACKSFADGSHVGCRGPSGPNRASISGSGPRPCRPAPGSPGRVRRAGVEPPPAPDHR
jgi:hypothetical protein